MSAVAARAFAYDYANADCGGLRTTIGAIGVASKIGVHMNMLIETPAAEWTYAGMPATSFVDGMDPNFGKYYQFDLDDRRNAPTSRNSSSASRRSSGTCWRTWMNCASGWTARTTSRRCRSSASNLKYPFVPFPVTGPPLSSALVPGGGTAPAVASALLAAFGAWWPLALYWVLMAGIGLVTTFVAPETRGRNLNLIQDATDDVPPLAEESRAG